MSWSVSAIGKPAAVAVKLAGDFARIPLMQEPEETGKNAVATAVAAIVTSFPETHVVRVECNGTQSLDQKISTLYVRVDSLGAIVE